MSGSGNLECPTCYGDGWISDPNGAGTLTCPECLGGAPVGRIAEPARKEAPVLVLPALGAYSDTQLVDELKRRQQLLLIGTFVPKNGEVNWLAMSHKGPGVLLMGLAEAMAMEVRALHHATFLKQRPEGGGA